MAQYQRVSVKFWQDPEVRRWPDRTKLLAQYLLTCPHRVMEGLYWLPLAYVQADVGWNADAVAKTMAELEAAGFAQYDPEAEVVFVCKALKYHRPGGAKQMKAAVTAVSDVPKTALLAGFLSAAAEWSPDLHEQLIEAGITAVSEDYPKCIDTQSIVDSSRAGASPAPVPSISHTTPSPSPQAARRVKRAHALPDDWQPDHPLREEMAAELPTVDLDAETRKFRDYWHGAGKTKVDWRATWRNWIRTAAERAPPRTNGKPAIAQGDEWRALSQQLKEQGR